MAPIAITYTKIIFAIAMLFMADPKVSKVSFKTDNGTMMTFNQTAEGQWSHTEPTGPTTEESSVWTFDADKEVLQIKSSRPDGKTETLNLAKMIQVPPEGAKSSTVTIDGHMMIVTREGNDIVITTKESAQMKQEIHYEVSAEGAAK